MSEDTETTEGAVQGTGELDATEQGAGLEERPREPEPTQADAVGEARFDPVEAGMVEPEGEAGEAEQQAEQQEEQQEEATGDAPADGDAGEADSALSPEQAERAARLGVGDEELKELGGSAGMFLDKLEAASDGRLAEIGKRLGEAGEPSGPEGRQAPEAPEAPPAGTDAQAGQGPGGDSEKMLAALQEAGYDEPVLDAFRAMSERVKELEGIGSQWAEQQRAQEAERAESQRRRDASEYSEWLEGLDDSKKALLADPTVQEALRESVKALDRGLYATTGEQPAMKDLLGRAFRLAAGERLDAQAREAGKKDLMDAAKKRASSHQMPPSSQMKRPGGEGTMDDVYESIGAALEEHGFASEDSSGASDLLANATKPK